MGLKKKILIGIPIAIIVFFIIAATLVSLFGKKFIEAQIQQNLKMNTSIGSVHLGLPFSVTLNKLEIGSLFKAEGISFIPDLAGFLAGKIVLDWLTITEPVINIEQSSDGRLNFPELQQGAAAPPVYLTGLTIKKGKLNFVDRKIEPEGFTVRFSDINISLSKVMLPPTSLNTKFKLSARVDDRDDKQLGTIEGSGWVDFGPKDMDALLEVKDLQVVYFSPYYGSFISQRKLSSGKLNLKSQLKAKNDELEIASNLRLSGLVYAQQEQQKGGELTGLEFVKDTLDLFTDKEGNLTLDFSIKTKLDKPEITSEELKKVILKAAARNLANQRPEDVIEKLSNTMQQFKELGKQLKGIFKNKQ